MTAARGIRPRGSVAERFWAKVVYGPECWGWDGHLNRDGYGQLYVTGRQVKAHRVSWELHNAPPAPGQCVLHVCDNPGCVNPAHLYLGSQADNAADRSRRGRRAPTADTFRAGGRRIAALTGPDHPNWRGGPSASQRRYQEKRRANPGV